MAVCIEFTDVEYIMWKLDFSEAMEDGERLDGCWIERMDEGEYYIIAKGNSICGVTAKW